MNRLQFDKLVVAGLSSVATGYVIFAYNLYKAKDYFMTGFVLFEAIVSIIIVTLGIVYKWGYKEETQEEPTPDKVTSDE